MGIDIDRERFTEDDYRRFGQRLEQSLEVLGRMLARPRFGTGERTVGAELELFLVDEHGRPLPENTAIRGLVDDPRLTLELDKFNLEVNPSPSSLAGRPFEALGRELRAVLEQVRRVAAGCGGRVAMIGILPSLRPDDLRRESITDSPRYRALDQSMKRLRREPFRIEIRGTDPEPVRIVRDDLGLEGANTSFQVHLRVDPDDFCRVFNAAQLATAPVLAVSGNSPVLLGRMLWEETRIALFEQAADDRDEPSRGRLVSRVAFGTDWLRRGALELFEESVRHHEPLLPVLGEEDPLASLDRGGVPGLEELRLHQSTVWRWNRAVYDAALGGHLRIEMRALPAGPTMTDMLANAAFLLGLTLAVAGGDQDCDPDWTGRLLFSRAHANFYEAARHGLPAELEWPGAGRPPRRTPAAELVAELLPVARRGLDLAGVAASESGPLLEVIAERAASRRTGSWWQRQTVAALEPRVGRWRALELMLERYLELQGTERPVHTWPVER
jgi:gamma-glutamyl:cysteine ligase YbdK (ATP-grasp superfamily)